MPQLRAAGVVVALASAAGAWWAAGAWPGGGREGGPGVLGASDRTAVTPAAAGPPPSYDQAVAELEQVLEGGRHRLDPATVATLERSLDAIDRAIAEAESALARDPGSDLLLRLLGSHRHQRVRALRMAAAALRRA